MGIRCLPQGEDVTELEMRIDHSEEVNICVESLCRVYRYGSAPNMYGLMEGCNRIGVSCGRMKEVSCCMMRSGGFFPWNCVIDYMIEVEN